MLKSTHRPVPGLPPGWTEHKAPTGHTYYYNTETKQSTYSRPAAAASTTAITSADSEDLQIDYNATAPDQVVRASLKAMDEFHRHNANSYQRGQGQFTGGRGYQDRNTQHQQHQPHRQPRGKYQDRPRTKAAIPNCEPWILVKTKFGRRFVHNAETKDSFWKFPQDVMMAVIKMDRMEELRAKEKAQAGQPTNDKKETDKEVAARSENQDVAHGQPAEGGESYDSDEYEEVEVTDNEDDNGDGNVSKRPRIDRDQQLENVDASTKPVEFDEDDIAWQLAQMEADETDNGYSDNGEDFENEGNRQGLDDDEGGLALTTEDSASLFRSLLDDHRVDPYSTFDALLEYNPHVTSNDNIIDDPRWLSLPTMSSRRHAFTTWSRDRIAQRQQEESLSTTTSSQSQPKTLHPRITYLEFLMDHATPKLYWPEFKRKFKKEAVIKDLRFPDKDKEKIYREYVAKLKSGHNGKDVKKQKADFVDLLKTSLSPESVKKKTNNKNEGVKMENSESGPASTDSGAGAGAGAGKDLPESLLKDIRFYLVRDRKVRDELVEAYLQTLKD